MADTRKRLGTPIGIPALLLGGPGVALALPGVRTASFLASTVRQAAAGQAHDDIPTPRLSTRLAAKVAVDEAVRALMLGMARIPSRKHRRRIRGEIFEASELYEDRGWLDDPRAFHQDPPPLARPRISKRRVAGLDFEHVEFKSRYEPRREEPGRDRWLQLEPNATAHAWVMRHRDRERPWLISIPGFRMGAPGIDLGGLRAAHHHYDLGLNVLIPVLPLHGPRTIGARSGDGFISADALNTIHAEAQAMWDMRRMVGWARTQGATAIGVYGVSLGGYNTALLASLEKDLACAIAGIPASCFPSLLKLHAPRALMWLGEKLGIDWDTVERIMRVVSPLAIEPRVPHRNRYLFGGLADRLVPPEHVHNLWEHWQRPRIAWYTGSHLSFRWETEVRSLMREAFDDSGLLAHATDTDADTDGRAGTTSKRSRAA